MNFKSELIEKILIKLINNIQNKKENLLYKIMNFTIQRFWELVDDIRNRWDKDDGILQDFYIKELKRLSNDEIIIFHHIFGHL